MKMKIWKTKTRTKSDNGQKSNVDKTSNAFSQELDVNLKAIKEKIGHNWDVHFREFELGCTGIRAAIVYIEGLSNKELINNIIMRSLMANFTVEPHCRNIDTEGISIDFIKDHVLTVCEVEVLESINELVIKVLTGSTALLINGLSQTLLIGTTQEKTRNIEEPVSETLVRGPRVGFTEALSDNTALLRGNGKIDNLSMIKYQVGTRVKKDLVVAYITDIADTDLVQEVERRIQRIDIDHAPESGFIEQLIEDDYLSPFPQVQNTERPDRVMAALTEGRVAILLDGTPFALIVPVTFSMMLQSPEDYNIRWIPGSFFRLLRFLAAILSLLTPAMYIAFISFHPGLIPTKLAISIMNSRVPVPYPALVEALFMEISIEILREANLRLPKPIGSAIGIVGGLIIGEAAVQAGIVGPILVIVVALTAISSFALPQYDAGIALRLLRFTAMFCAAIFGLYGLVLFILFIISHLVKLKSFGVPYVSPTVPYRLNDWKDFMVRMPLMMMKRRPKILHTENPVRKR